MAGLMTPTTLPVRVPRGYEPSYGSGRYYANPVGTGTATAAFAANTLYCHPFVVWRRSRWDQIACRTGTAAGPGTLGRMAVLWCGRDGTPGESRFEPAGTVDLSVGTSDRVITIDITLDPGAYFLAFVGSGASTLRTTNGNRNILPSLLGSLNPGNNSWAAVSRAYTYGAIGDQNDQTWTRLAESDCPAMHLRAA